MFDEHPRKLILINDHILFSEIHKKVEFKNADINLVGKRAWKLLKYLQKKIPSIIENEKLQNCDIGFVGVHTDQINLCVSKDDELFAIIVLSTAIPVLTENTSN